jgi:hypothetical protein
MVQIVALMVAASILSAVRMGKATQANNLAVQVDVIQFVMAKCPM